MKYGEGKYMLRYRYENIFEYLKIKEEIKEPSVSESNVDWYLQQLLKNIQLSKNVAVNIMRNHRMDWIKPPSLKDYDLNNGPTFTECFLFDAATKEFIHLILERMKEFNKTKKYIQSTKVHFVKSIISTRIKVEEKTVYLYTYNEDLSKRIKEMCEKEGYDFIQIHNLKQMRFYKWEGQRTNEN